MPSDAALEDLAARVVIDFWAERRRVRESRPFSVAALLDASALRRAA